ncbi:MAG: exodeoxyribonuclease V subunit gamma [Pseudomonadota bacterium]
MKQFRLIHGNRLEMISEMLSEILKTPLSSPLDPEIIIVQSQGMSRWLNMEVAKHLGISANLKFFFPNDFLQFVFHRLVPDFSDSVLNDRATVTWILMRMLPELADNDRFIQIRQYLEDDMDEVKRFQLAGRLADTFDQYLLFRPEMILEWENGKADHWQAELWRRLSREGDIRHRARQNRILTEYCRQKPSLPSGFPERITVFGISALPGFHMQLFDILSRFIPVNLFLMNPCRQYWGDILSNREITGRQTSLSRTPASAEDLHLAQGNPLLAAMGTMGRDFFDMVHTLECDEIDIFTEPGRDTLLQHIQSDILDLTAASAGESGTVEIPETDRSVSIHSCHSPMRELEVLHNHILSFFEHDRTLTPGSILVMTPDIESYAPYIHAVFNRQKDDPQWIPYSIADRSMLNESMVIRTFFAILDLHSSRFRLTDILQILESSDIRASYQLTGEDMALIRKWVAETRIRWGIDSAFREKIGLPGIGDNTWEAGIERLLLGYAMLNPQEQTFQGILPYDVIEGSSTEALGKFLAFIHDLFTKVQSLSLPRTIPDWIPFFEDLLHVFFSSTDHGDMDVHALREAIHTLGEKAVSAAFHQKTTLEVIRSHLKETMENKGFGTGFISGGITFSAMLPMRSIPFDVICLLGMNHDAYPRQNRDSEFNLISRHPRPGDRSRRNDDQYLFLESILSARKNLYVSYLGRSIQDNSSIPPSVLVSELMQTIETGFFTKNNSIRRHVLTEHKLQPFHSLYFTASGENACPDKYFSYSEEDLKGAESLQNQRCHPGPFFTDDLPAPESPELDLPSFLRFWNNPCQYIVNNRLGIFLDRPEKEPADREPFSMESLERYQLFNDLLEQMIQGADPSDIRSRIRAKGILPHRTTGDVVFEMAQDRASGFFRKLEPFIRPEKCDPLSFSFPVAGITIQGKIDSIYPDHAFFYRYGVIGPKDLFAVWVKHLIINHIAPANYPRYTVLGGLSGSSVKDASWTETRFLPVDNAGELLTGLADCYLSGIRKPLKFFPKTSYRFADLIQNAGHSPGEALKKAETLWIGNDHASGEYHDRYVQFCFKNEMVLDEAFAKIAVDIFKPMMMHSENQKKS